MFSQVWYKYDVGYISYIVEDENWRATLRLINNKIFKGEENVLDIDKLGRNVCFLMHARTKW